MDGRDALPRAAPDGTSWFNQIALGRERDRTETEILFAQKRRQARDAKASRTMVAGSLRFGWFEKGTICLTSKNQSWNGDGRCSPPGSKRPCAGRIGNSFARGHR